VKKRNKKLEGEVTWQSTSNARYAARTLTTGKIATASRNEKKKQNSKTKNPPDKSGEHWAEANNYTNIIIPLRPQKVKENGEFLIVFALDKYIRLGGKHVRTEEILFRGINRGGREPHWKIWRAGTSKGEEAEGYGRADCETKSAKP